MIVQAALDNYSGGDTDDSCFNTVSVCFKTFLEKSWPKLFLMHMWFCLHHGVKQYEMIMMKPKLKQDGSN